APVVDPALSDATVAVQPAPPSPPPPAKPAAPAAKEKPKPPASAANASKGLSRSSIAIIAGVLLVAASAIVVTYVRSRVNKPSPGQITAAATIPVAIQSAPADATVMVNGEARTGTVQLDPNAAFDVVVSRAGFKTFHESGKHPAAQWSFTLEPETVHLH